MVVCAVERVDRQRVLRWCVTCCTTECSQKEKRSLVITSGPGSCLTREYRILRKNKVINYVEETVLLNRSCNTILISNNKI